MSDHYKITIRCDHGDRKPRIATAHYDGTTWHLLRPSSDAKARPRSGWARFTPNQSTIDTGETKIVEHEGETRQAIRNTTLSSGDDLVTFAIVDGRAVPTAGEVKERHGIVCVTCRKRKVGADSMERMFDEARHAGMHTIVV